VSIAGWTLAFVVGSFALYTAIAIASRVGTTSGFYVAGRGVSAVANGMATGADWMSAASFISMAGLISFMGYDGAIYLMGLTGGYVLLALLVAPYLRRYGRFTIPEFVGDRYASNAARFVAVACAIFISVTYVAGQMRGVGVVFSRFLTVPVEYGVILGGVIERRRVSGEAPDDFMQTLSNALYQDGRSLTDEEVIGILLTVLFAGQHTSAVLATWTGLELMAAPGYTSRVRDEISEIYEGNGALSHDSLKHQPLLDYAVQEGERLHPPLILLVRRVMEDLSYDGYRVGKGTLAMVSPAVAHRLPEVFEDPQRFHPDRFGPPSFEGKQHHYALIGFGGGKHRCMGRHFAYVQLKAIWTVLLDRLEFHRDGGVPASNYGSWVTGPIEPCRVQYRKRRQPAAVK